MNLRFIRRIMWGSWPSVFGQSIEKIPPNEALEELETLSGHATLIIFAGIAFEVFVIWRFDEGLWKKLLDTCANALIGIGLVLEYFCIRRAILATRAANRESELKVAEARKQA